MPRVLINHEAADVPTETAYELVAVLATAGHNETRWIVTYENAEEGSGELRAGELVHVIDGKTTFSVRPPLT